MKNKIQFLLIAFALSLTAYAQSDPDQKVVDMHPSLYYTFDDDDITRPSIGNVFLEVSPEVNVIQFLDFSLGKKAITVERTTQRIGKIKVPNPTNVAQSTFTILWDVSIPDWKEYRTLFQTHPTGVGDDGDLFIHPDDGNAPGGSIGQGSYTSYQMPAEEWHRIVLVVADIEGDESHVSFTVYVDGNSVITMTKDKSREQIPANYFWIFSDNDGEDGTIDCSGLAFWPGMALNPEEVALMGGCAPDIKSTPYNGPHTAPCIVEAEDFDTGGEGYTYHSNNEGVVNAYRPESVAIEAGPGENNYHLATIKGEWFNYTIEVPELKDYNFILVFYGQKTTSDVFSILVNGRSIENATKDIEFKESYDEGTELLVSIVLKQGKNIISILSDGGNFDRFEVNKYSPPYTGTPFFEAPYIVPANGELVIEAEFFDRGGREIAFHDSQTNGGNAASKAVRGEEDGSENVEMEYRNPEGGENATIGWSAAGDWLAYSLNVAEDGKYDVFYVLSTNNGDRKQHIQIDNTVYPEIIAHTPGDWLIWMDFMVATNVNLKAGRHTLYTYYDGNFDKIKIRKHADVKPYENTPQTIPGTIQAWKFDEGGEGLTYWLTNKTLGGENNAIRTNVAVPVGGNEADGYFVDVKEANTPWRLSYTVNVEETAYYNVTFKANCENTGGIELSGATSTSVQLSATEGAWQEITVPVVKLTAGENVLKVSFSGSSFKILSFKFEKTEIVDRSNWLVLAVSDETASDGGGKDMLFDDNIATYWHSQWQPSNAALPHWAVINMVNPTEINKIITYRRTNGDTKTLQYFVGDNPDVNADTWTPIAEGAYAAQNDGIHYLSLDATTTVKARYLKLNLPDSFREPFTSIAEVYVHGVAYTGINHSAATLSGSVYVENGRLYAKELSATATLDVYNMLGQKVANRKTISNNEAITLPAKGIYLVKVQDKNQSMTYKVLAK